MNKFDEIDKKILNILQERGRMTNANLAAEVGLSPPPMLERVKKLEKNKLAMLNMTSDLRKTISELEKAEEEVRQLTQSLTGLMEPLGAYAIDLAGLVTIDQVEIGEENVVGVRLPVAREVKFRTAERSCSAKPIWICLMFSFALGMSTFSNRLTRCVVLRTATSSLRTRWRRTCRWTRIVQERCKYSTKKSTQNGLASNTPNVSGTCGIST